MRSPLFAVLLVCGGSSEAAPLGVVIELRDGSRIVGEVELDRLTLATSYGELKLKPGSLQLLTPVADRERVTVKAGEDSITGVPTPAKLDVKTSFGRVSISLALATRVEFTRMLAPGAAPPPPAVPPAHDTIVPELSFRCEELTSIDGRTMTTGGSVWVHQVKFRSGPPLLLIEGTRERSSRLAAGVDRLESCKGSKQLIRVLRPKWVAPTYTEAGALNGWAAFVADMTVD